MNSGVTPKWVAPGEDHPRRLPMTTPLVTFLVEPVAADKKCLRLTTMNPMRQRRSSSIADDNVAATECEMDDGNESEITMDKIMKALKQIKLGKTADFDRLWSEMLRGGGSIVANLLYQLFKICWKNHRVPNDWCKAVIVPLYNGKGSQQFGIN
ncbi:hypothetical protein EVAR_82844_1 [Eumeta japonica]|uniref:RNA-directed DNA polymerase from transposon BS n=1 Tax=Eumeta variegata TaxID=151549 RepID=A0A4C1V3S4_EUMVA|nr:hypothetical protein EVAR_82844_1 [Eumeta japonica]